MRVAVLMGDFLALIHGLAVLTMVFAPVVFWLSRRRVPWLEQLFLVVAGVTTASYLLTGECFLTTWEQALRSRGTGETAYRGGFVSYYLARVGIHWPDAMTLPAAVVLIVLAASPMFLRWWDDRKHTS